MEEDIMKFKATQKLDCLQVDSINKTFKVKGQSSDAFQKKKSGLVKTAMAISTCGMSTVLDKALKFTKEKIYSFSDLHSFELLEDNSTITSGGTGLALAATALTGSYAAGAMGGIIGKKKTKKIIESMIIKLNVNDFDCPCIMIPLITKSTKVGSNEYKEAYNQAQKIISMLDLITHNN